MKTVRDTVELWKDSTLQPDNHRFSHLRSNPGIQVPWKQQASRFSTASAQLTEAGGSGTSESTSELFFQGPPGSIRGSLRVHLQAPVLLIPSSLVTRGHLGGLFFVDNHSGDALHVLQSVGVKVHQEPPDAGPHGGEGQRDGQPLAWSYIITSGGEGEPWNPSPSHHQCFSCAVTYLTWTWVAGRSPAPSTVKTPPLRGTGRGLVKEMWALTFSHTTAFPGTWRST